MIEIIICTILAAGCFFGGWFTRDLTKPTTNIQNINTTQETTSIQQNLQIQSTVFSPNTNITISIKDYTNYLKYSSRSNTLTN